MVFAARLRSFADSLRYFATFVACLLGGNALAAPATELLPPASTSDWGTPFFDNAHTGRSPAVLDPTQLVLKWRAPIGYGAPLVVGNMIFAQGDNTRVAVSAFDVATGQLHWTHSDRYGFPSPPVYFEGLIFMLGTLPTGRPFPEFPTDLKLVVLDAETGATRYVVSLASEDIGLIPPVVTRLAGSNTLLAICASSYHITFVELFADHGSVVRKVASSLNGIPTVVENSLIVSNNGALQAIEISSGRINQFFHTTGSATTVRYDARNRQFYVISPKPPTGPLQPTAALRAFRFVSQDQIQELWSVADGTFDYQSEVAIGADGAIYTASFNSLVERRPTDGGIVRRATGTFDLGQAPILSRDYIWVRTGLFTHAYRLSDFTLTRRLSGGYNISSYKGGAAVRDDLFIVDYGRGGRAFELYGPSSIPPGPMLNLSTRMWVGSGGEVGIAGFVVEGSTPKRFLIRGIGPSLGAYGVANALANPTLEIVSNGVTVASNDDWRSTQAQEIQTTGLAPGSDLEAAVIVTLGAGSHTATLRGAGGGNGVALVEVYDLDTAVRTPHMINLSTRGKVQSGDGLLIAGFVVGGGVPKHIVVRALGPSLTAFGVTGVLQDPKLRLLNANGQVVAESDRWQIEPSSEVISALNLGPAFSECAIYKELPPGAYTAQVTGADGETGVALVEVYEF